MTPLTSPQDIAGYLCIECHKPATHWYGNNPLCCACHGGQIYDHTEAVREHDKMFAQLREEIKRLRAENKKLREEIRILSNNIAKLLKEKQKWNNKFPPREHF